MPREMCWAGRRRNERLQPKSNGEPLARSDSGKRVRVRVWLLIPTSYSQQPSPASRPPSGSLCVTSLFGPERSGVPGSSPALGSAPAGLGVVGFMFDFDNHHLSLAAASASGRALSRQHPLFFGVAFESCSKGTSLQKRCFRDLASDLSWWRPHPG